MEGGVQREDVIQIKRQRFRLDGNAACAQKNLEGFGCDGFAGFSVFGCDGDGSGGGRAQAARGYADGRDGFVACVPFDIAAAYGKRIAVAGKNLERRVGSASERDCGSGGRKSGKHRPNDKHHKEQGKAAVLQKNHSLKTACFVLLRKRPSRGCGGRWTIILPFLHTA